MENWFPYFLLIKKTIKIHLGKYLGKKNDSLDDLRTVRNAPSVTWREIRERCAVRRVRSEYSKSGCRASQVHTQVRAPFHDRMLERPELRSTGEIHSTETSAQRAGGKRAWWNPGELEVRLPGLSANRRVRSVYIEYSTMCNSILALFTLRLVCNVLRERKLLRGLGTRSRRVDLWGGGDSKDLKACTVLSLFRCTAHIDGTPIISSKPARDVMLTRNFVDPFSARGKKGKKIQKKIMCLMNNNSAYKYLHMNVKNNTLFHYFLFSVKSEAQCYSCQCWRDWSHWVMLRFFIIFLRNIF